MDFSKIEEKMGKTISVYKEKLAEVRAGRANPAILNKIKIDYDAVFKRNTKSVPPKKETQIVVVEEKKWYEKFVDWIKNIFKRNG